MDLDGTRCFIGFRTQFGDFGMHQLNEVSDDGMDASEVEFGSARGLKLYYFFSNFLKYLVRGGD